MAGYAYPEQEAYRLIRSPHIAAAIRQARFVAIETDVTTIAVNTLVETMRDAGAPRAVKVQAAKVVLGLGQFAKNANDPNGLGPKTIGNMTIEELREMAVKLRSEAQDDAPTSDHAGENAKVINAVADATTP